jgi:signal transduction histidine kinase/CheY-like chemotaxis protein
VGRDVNDLLCRDLDAALIPTIWVSIRGGHPWKGRFSNRTKDGRVILLDGSVSAIRGLSGAIIGYVSARRDVTRQVELEARLSQAGKLEAIGTLAGGIAHDFNNILSAIVGNTQLARMKCPDDAPVQHDLEVILQGARRATELIKQILTFSRNARHEEGLVQVGPIVSEVSALLRATVPATIEIRTDIQSTSRVVAAPATIHRAVLNLCTNALLAMNEREGVLEVGLEDVELDTSFARRFPGVSPGTFLRLWVRDTGRGMARDVAEHVFEPFYTTRDVGKGTGMGLAVVHGIVMSLHGAITVESEVDKGTTFEMYLPVARAAVPDAVAPSEELCRGTERVLVVDDDPLVLETMVDMLRELGYQVRSETCGAAAQAAFEQDPQAFDLVITDMTMPGIAGGALAAWLKHRRPDLPVIACSGYTEEQVPEGTSVHAIDEFLMKPLFMDTLAQLLRKLLDGSSHATPVTGAHGAQTTSPSVATPA